MRDGCLSKLTITESANRAIQYKKITDALPVCCADKGYTYINDISCTNTELLQTANLLPYLLAAQWSTTYHIEIETVNPLAIPGVDRSCTPIKQMVEKTHVFNSNLQKQLLSEYYHKSKIKSQEWAKLTVDKKALMTIICGQCNDATVTKLALGSTYAADCDNRNQS